MPLEPATTVASTTTPPIVTRVVAAVSKGGCGHPALALPPIISSVLFPVVVAETPHVAGIVASGSAPSASGHSSAKEGCATPCTVIGTLRLCAVRPGAVTEHSASATRVGVCVRSGTPRASIAVASLLVVAADTAIAAGAAIATLSDVQLTVATSFAASAFDVAPRTTLMIDCAPSMPSSRSVTCGVVGLTSEPRTCVGASVGCAVGAVLGATLGADVGAAVGAALGP